ncbi:hypothetical protein EDC30_102232 [Paucimonas lemoignei]|uniref:Uncharacterized protein n=1 Tax=Paucimonas lemoignei TaxID=29443 RepID=A0A4R3I0J0_PAULE|nr:host-nuclease inhibitor Gam family protein [Paucimonas lemoignei]TCS38493.1 hypothetical protein EDC30_102232 [Paucimonas lemoignei]
MENLKEIERAALAYSIARNALSEQVNALHGEIEQIKRSKLGALRRAVERAAERQTELHDLVSHNRALFDKPKTRILHGVKVGYMKQPGVIEIADEAATLERLKKMFESDPATLQLLIKVTEKPIKDALAELSGDKLRKLGVRITDDSDKVVIKPADSEVDKVVDALLKGVVEE